MQMWHKGRYKAYAAAVEKVNNTMEYIASYSGGKDSTATVILAHEYNEPLNKIIISEVMFDKTISAE